MLNQQPHIIKMNVYKENKNKAQQLLNLIFCKMHDKLQF